MLKTLIYLLGILALTYTDLSSPSAFYSLFLPFVDLLFICFIGLELMIYFSAISIQPDGYSIYNLLHDLFYLRDDIREVGLVSAVSTLMLSVIDMILLFTAVIYALNTLLEITTGL